MRRSVLLAVMLGLASAALAAPPVTMTAEEDHRAMMHELGITSLRPAPSGDPKAPKRANYDEARANP